MFKEAFFWLKWGMFAPGVRARFRGLLANERRPLEDLSREQEAAKRRLVERAVREVPFYREHYGKVGFEIGDMGQEGWFERLPIVTKADLRAHFEAMTNPALRRYRKISTTGGSTGTPTKAGYDGRLCEAVYSWRLQEAYGVHPWDDHAYVWRLPRASRVSRFVNAALWWPSRHLKLDASFMDERSIEAFLGRYNRVRPMLLQGYVGAITQLAQFAFDRGLEVWSPKCVWVTSAPLAAVQRALIGEVFGAPVCDQYGSCEVRWIAQQCPEAKGLHVNVEHVAIEFVDARNRAVPRGEYGKVLLTNLEDFVFPLIRYENGDRGRWLTEPCPCGRTLPCIDTVKGRVSESFVMPSGMVVNGEFLTTLFDNDPDLVHGFRVTQHKDASITVNYIPAKETEAARKRLAAIQSALEARLDREVPVRFVPVAELPHDRGKLRFVVREMSGLNNPLGGGDLVSAVMFAFRCAPRAQAVVWFGFGLARGIPFDEGDVPVVFCRAA